MVIPRTPVLALALALVLGALAGGARAAGAALPPEDEGPRRVPPVAGKDETWVLLNIPSRRLRVYKGAAKVFDVPMGVGRLDYPGEKGNTRSRIGSHRIESWHKGYRSRAYPISWEADPWRGPFGAHTAKLGPQASYQYIHGTIGPATLGNWLIEKREPAPPEDEELPSEAARRLAEAEYGLSHGCVRLSNDNIGKLRALAPVGTRVEKIYCLTERFQDGQGGSYDVVLPNVYAYRKVAFGAVLWPETGTLEGYRHPEDAVGPR